MPRQSKLTCHHFGSRPSLTEHGSRAECDIKSRTGWFCSSHIYLFFVGKTEEVFPIIASQMHCKGDVATQQTWGCSNSTNLQEILQNIRFMSYRFYLEMIGLKRRNVESERCKAFNNESRIGVRWSVLCIPNQVISFDAWIYGPPSPPKIQTIQTI